jgi:hypothetical protein
MLYLYSGDFFENREISTKSNRKSKIFQDLSRAQVELFYIKKQDEKSRVTVFLTVFLS